MDLPNPGPIQAGLLGGCLQPDEFFVINDFACSFDPRRDVTVQPNGSRIRKNSEISQLIIFSSVGGSAIVEATDMNRTLVLAVFLTFCTPCVAQEMRVKKLLAQSDVAMQKQISTASNAKTEVELFQHLQTLKKMSADEGQLVKQLAIFVATPGLDERQRLMAPVVLHLLQLQPKIIIRALAPHLDSENENVRSFVRDWFQGHDICAEGPSTLLALNYDDYLDYVRGQLNRNEEVPTAFIEYIYERSPERALIVFNYANPILHAETVARLLEMQKKFKADWQKREKTELDKRFPLKIMSQQEINELQKRVDRQPNKLTLEERKQQLREVHLAEHLVSHAIWLKENDYEVRFYKTALPEASEQLEKLSKHDGWWDRLYVAEIMRRHREFRQADILEKLSQDSNALVSKSASGRNGRNSSARPQEFGNRTLVAPRNVQARAIGPTSIEVTWEASVGATSYAVQRRQTDTETEFTTIAPHVSRTSYTDSGLTKGALYEYRVMANQDSTKVPSK